MRSLTLFLVFSLLLAVPMRAEEPLRNDDVLKMVAAGLGDELVVAKVREAPAVSFALDVDDLVVLKERGVSERVVQAMLERKARSSPLPSQAPAPAWNPWAGTGYQPVEVELQTSERSVALTLLRGEMVSPGFAGFGATYVNYPGLRAAVRTRDRRPSLLVRSAVPLTAGGSFLAKLDRDEDDGVRSLKIAAMKSGLKAVFGKGSQKIEPDSDWTVAFDSVEESPGLWRVTAKRDLEPGEYGWYVGLTGGGQAACLFGFGVD